MTEISREASKEDIEQYFPGVPKPTMRAWVGEIDGEMVAIGGWAFDGSRWYAFFDMSDKLEKMAKNNFGLKMMIAKTAKQIIMEADKQGILALYVMIDTEKQNAKRWLINLGFEKMSSRIYRREYGGV